MENDTLDIGQLQETDEYWFEDIDMTCPFCNGGEVFKKCEKCNGEGEYECPNSEHKGMLHNAECDDPDCENGYIGCEECKGLGEVETDETCEECDGNGHFEILWNTAFRVPYLKSGLDFAEARNLAWKEGWLLFTYENEKWLAAGSCGYDFTWRLARCAFEICGDLPDFFANNMTRGGEVFVHDPSTKLALIEAAKTSKHYQVLRLNRSIDELTKLATDVQFKVKMWQEASHATEIKES